MPFYPCRGGGNLKPPYFCVQMNNNASTINFRSEDIKKIETYEFAGNGSTGTITCRIVGYNRATNSSKELLSKSVQANSVSKDNPWVIEAPESAKDWPYTQFNFSAEAVYLTAHYK